MKTFLNEEKKQFKDLSDEEMLAIVKAKIAGKCEVMVVFGHASKWCAVDDIAIDLRQIYRTKPPKQLVIPWDVLRKDIKHVVIDEDRRVFGYSEIKGRDREFWEGEGVADLTALDLDTSGIDWETSLVTRPEGV